jgi:multidrug resistance protein MdtO
MPEKIAKYTWSAESRGPPFLEMLWETLKPFPGRAQLTLRLAVICTAVVLVADTFRLPFQDLMPFFILFITKEDKVTTAVSALMVLSAVTVAIAAAIVIYKCTGDRPEFRIPAIAAEIFVGMYLFRVLSIGPVGWILGFICAAAQSLVYLVPSPEETVHLFLWLWVAIAFSVSLAWLANLLLFPVSATRLLQREFVSGWNAISAATAQLAANSPSAGAGLVRPLIKRGPVRFLKLLKLSSIESPDLRGKQIQLSRMILSLDKTARLIFSYARARLKSSVAIAIPSNETAILGGLKEDAECFQREFEAGFLPSATAIRNAAKTAGDVATLQLLEAKSTIEDLVAEDTESENRLEKASTRHKPSLFVADAFSNPRHVQFALKVTLAGMLGYLFYTASDYYGIHTVFYTPLIIALASTGATVHKGLLRIAGCIIGGALGLIGTIWIIPRFETLGTFLLIVFFVHGLAAWIAIGSDRISYIGLQIALAFDLGFLQGYGPPTEIDPLRDRFIGILLGIGIITIVFSLVWPESADSSARERLAVGLRAIARLLHLGGSKDGSQSSGEQREQLELEIASRLAEANSYEEQAAFEALLYGSEVTEVSRLAEAADGVEEIYVACLPWLREQVSSKLTSADGEDPKTAPGLTKLLGDAMAELAEMIEGFRYQTASQVQSSTDRLLEEKDREDMGLGASSSSRSLEELISALVQLQNLGQTLENIPGRRR